MMMMSRAEPTLIYISIGHEGEWLYENVLYMGLLILKDT